MERPISLGGLLVLPIIFIVLINKKINKHFKFIFTNLFILINNNMCIIDLILYRHVFSNQHKFVFDQGSPNLNSRQYDLRIFLFIKHGFDLIRTI